MVAAPCTCRTSTPDTEESVADFVNIPGLVLVGIRQSTIGVVCVVVNKLRYYVNLNMCYICSKSS
jgi:hypothetical protein